MSNAVSSQVIGELPEPPKDIPTDIAEISADMPLFDLEKVKGRAAIGRFVVGDVVAKIVADCISDRDAIDAVQAKLLEKLPKLNDVKDIALVAEATKNLVNTGVASSTLLLKCAETLAFGQKKKNRQVNAPQAIINGDNAQVIVGGVPVVTP